MDQQEPDEVEVKDLWVTRKVMDIFQAVADARGANITKLMAAALEADAEQKEREAMLVDRAAFRHREQD